MNPNYLRGNNYVTKPPNIDIFKMETTVLCRSNRTIQAQLHSITVKDQVNKGQAVKQMSSYEVRGES